MHVFLLCTDAVVLWPCAHEMWKPLCISLRYGYGVRAVPFLWLKLHGRG